jgi:hypothetical protein
MTLHEQDLTQGTFARQRRRPTDSASTAYSSSLTLTVKDGSELHDEQAHSFLARKSSGWRYDSSLSAHVSACPTGGSSRNMNGHLGSVAMAWTARL